MAELDGATNKKPSTKKVVTRAACIILVIVALVGGYVYGSNKATSDAEKELQQKVTSLQNDLNKATAAVGNEVQEGQQDIAEGQQTVEALKSENAALKQTISQQNQKIADLEKQLEEAKKANATQ